MVTARNGLVSTTAPGEEASMTDVRKRSRAPALAAVVGLVCSAASAQTELATLHAADAAAGDDFGAAVGRGDALAIVGARHEGPPADAGAAYVFRQTGSTWSQEAKLVASDRASGDEFGVAVTIEGSLAVVGAWQEEHLGIESGSAYAYRFNGASWVQHVKLVAADRALGDRFGIAVSMDGGLLAIGADRASHGLAADAGAVYLYRNDGFNLNYETKLTASDTFDFDAFGMTVAVSGNRVLVGAPRSDGAGLNSGSAYVFAWDTDLDAWVQEQKITPFDAAPGDQFGTAVAISGTTLVIGAPFNDDAGSGSGSAYVYELAGESWTLAVKLNASDAEVGDNFGISAALRGSSLVVGAHADGPADNGSAYFFRRDGATWVEDGRVTPASGQDLDQFGSSAAIGDDLIALIGAAGEDDGGSSAGAAYLFQVVAVADSDGDGLNDGEELALGTDPDDPDTDDDGLSDGAEVAMAAGGDCPDPLRADTDGDGLTDGAENGSGPDPCDSDTDDDGLLDGLEAVFGTDATNPDTDGDGLTDGQEVALAAGSGCPNPLLPDSDGDALGDGIELGMGLDPCSTDSDGDGLADGAEGSFGTRPTDRDTDDDSVSDGDEVAFAMGSGCPSPLDPDSDGDGILDGDEITGGLRPCDADGDHDGLADGNEAAYGTDPADPDTDDDGMSDGAEVDSAMGTGCPDPRVPDSDGDTIVDGAEPALGSDPCSRDSDGDGLDDAEDPTPATPGATPEFLEAMARALAAEVRTLETSLFLGPSTNVRAARRSFIASQLVGAANAIRNGNPMVAVIRLLVVHSLVDGASPPQDWMLASVDQAFLRDDVENLVELLLLTF
jgi:hypothetical protein